MAETRMYSETICVDDRLSVTVRDLRENVFAVEVASVEGTTYEPQRLLLDLDGLMRVGSMIRDYAQYRFPQRGELPVHKDDT
jgi:hypothetical protein